MIIKEMLKKNFTRIREDCGVFGISNIEDASALILLGYMPYNTEDKRVAVLYLMTVIIIFPKKDLA